MLPKTSFFSKYFSDVHVISHQKTCFSAPEPANPLQITVCTLAFAEHTIFLGPERVYCRRQLRSAPGRRPPGVLGFVRCSVPVLLQGTPAGMHPHCCFSVVLLFFCMFPSKKGTFLRSTGGFGGNAFWAQFFASFFWPRFLIDLGSFLAPFLTHFFTFFHEFLQAVFGHEIYMDSIHF